MCRTHGLQALTVSMKFRPNVRRVSVVDDVHNERGGSRPRSAGIRAHEPKRLEQLFVQKILGQTDRSVLIRLKPQPQNAAAMNASLDGFDAYQLPRCRFLDNASG
jgi:hypothetical protein